MSEMTLGRALRILHERGRLAQPWLPGMLLKDELSSAMFVRLAWADDVYWHGAYGRKGHKPINGGWLRIHHVNRNDYTPDRTDPATVGCLAALAREALRDPLAHVRWTSRGDHLGWFLSCPNLGWMPGPYDTEGAAWGAALIRLARELTVGEVLGG